MSADHSAQGGDQTGATSPHLLRVSRFRSPCPLLRLVPALTPVCPRSSRRSPPLALRPSGPIALSRPPLSTAHCFPARRDDFPQPVSRPEVSPGVHVASADAPRGPELTGLVTARWNRPSGDQTSPSSSSRAARSKGLSSCINLPSSVRQMQILIGNCFLTLCGSDLNRPAVAWAQVTL